ncbi:VapC toxin family PIN domain ribonuclease [Kaistia algarum]|uniref:type II toxin-antitoxin system VapC family toxin n=1 Tax=Kaistia algarum TaxID=2083279 RepID=UPI000CE8501B|nr:type II toxin-antitoxin system VapC family toxin [Kaistia algarum]MCX5513582.1 type II toxin-antitoxin system VapC family toxin [Kaistia algarum]PPE77645.1 VapC toxin family PIN domain ribonuclease [Kaistia algarum]
MIILDTNVLSELMRPEADASPVVLDWFAFLDPMDAFITSITMAEILSGIEFMPQGRRRSEKQAAALAVLALFSGRVLPFDEAAASHYAIIIAGRRRIGRSTSAPDTQIAAIARARGFAVATRDDSGFDNAGIEIINPWEPPA